jgi:hypothetical protein
MKVAEWGDAVVERLTQFMARTETGLRGFTRRNLFRMRQFYEAYRQDQKSVAAGGTIAVDLQTDHPWAEQAVRGTRILSADGCK